MIVSCVESMCNRSIRVSRWLHCSSDSLTLRYLYLVRMREITRLDRYLVVEVQCKTVTRWAGRLLYFCTRNGTTEYNWSLTASAAA